MPWWQKAKEDAKLFKEAQLKSLREDAASKMEAAKEEAEAEQEKALRECKRRLLHLGRRRRRKNHRPLRP